MGARRAPARRTQQERREGTIRKLLDAATGALIDVGYAAASVQVICERAGLSQGALFRHFPTREALMVAVGEDVGRQTLERYRHDFARLRGEADPRDLAMRLVRTRCRSRVNQAWYELAMAARTSPRLRRGLRPVAATYYRDIERLARETLPDLAAQLGERFPLLVDTIIAVFDGETLHRFVLPKPGLENARIELLGLLARSFGA
ncbi:MAG TPA: helix-turn-helix domain-containing protein [Polyangiaceae bacterium]